MLVRIYSRFSLEGIISADTLLVRDCRKPTEAGMSAGTSTRGDLRTSQPAWSRERALSKHSYLLPLQGLPPPWRRRYMAAGAARGAGWGEQYGDGFNYRRRAHDP